MLFNTLDDPGPIDPQGRVIIVGSGKSMVDRVVSLLKAGHMQGDASGNSAEGDVASVPHHILDLHAKRGHKRLTVFRNPRLNASGCQQPPGALSGTRAVLVPRFAIGARCVLVDKEMADEGLTAINTGFGG